jgi:hypothetical protein
MKNRAPHQVLDEIVQERVRPEIDLSTGILAKIRKEEKQMKKSRMILVTILALAIVLTITFSIPDVAQAVKRLLGYLPGTGWVDQSLPLRVLEEPGQTAHEETTVIVDQAVIDAEHTVVVYQVKNISATFLPQEESGEEMCHQNPKIVLPDGSQLEGQINSSNYWGSGYSQQIVFSPLSEKINSATFVLPCLPQTLNTTGQLKWEIPLKFVAAPAQMTIYPIVDLPASTEAATLPALSPTSDNANGNPTAADFSLSLSKYIQTNENVILLGKLNSAAANINTLYVEDEAIHLRDASGTEVPLTADPSFNDPTAGIASPQTLPLIYQSTGQYTPGKAIFTVDSVWVNLDPHLQFSLDVGSSVSPDQVLPINQTLRAAGTSILIKSARVDSAGKGLSFDLEVPENVAEVALLDLDHSTLSGGGGDNNYGFTYKEEFPSGVITVTLTSLTIKINGPWQDTIDLPAFANVATPASTTDACLTPTTWQTALQNPASTLPTDLTGTLAFDTLQEPGYLYHVGIAPLSDRQEKILALGSDPDLSPDGNELLFSGDAGLERINIATGEITPVQNTSVKDSQGLWSPAGDQIVFSRKNAIGQAGLLGPKSLILANPDGSNLHVLLENTDVNTAQAWFPDGKSILYTTKTSEGVWVNSIEIATGRSVQLFQINYVNAGVALSPDGKRVAYEAMLPGEHYALYVADLDGSNARLIANPAPNVATHPIWSPDGHWLIVSVQDETLTTEAQMPVLTLINVDSCQIIPLKEMVGYVSTWRQ